MSRVDWRAVNRRIKCAEQEIANTREWIAAAEAGEYSPLMSSEFFEEKFNEAVEALGADPQAICIFKIPRPHRCARCEAFLQTFMQRKAVAAHG